ncbi:hypothetical protein MNEG_6350 [Monoraphidium neglectum]|uniref:Vacuolar protein sorting-associated protein 54 C-terminal domain-containing protein n=1 Tax=Monoraphidium neglectum TaxID=145388 RepID=A0A0D2L2Z1_9CHLO|nr:hypothetical protein MNEG_6350 [Monoraphidium neglectum]KIZ01614.1 hypothetical protein MNEG_6350 [Monoraphidium neglectum]|eukprot:XP_013900633.1 hypothetical protein MNEG_6350 [Monoraphidium neglectum]
MSSSLSQALSSHNKRRGTLHDDIDRSVYTVGQTLVSIVNDPRTAGLPASTGFWGFGSHDAPQADAQPPPIDASKYPAVSQQDLNQYLKVVRGAYERFVRDRESLEAFDHARPLGGGGAGGSGAGGGAEAEAEGTPFGSGGGYGGAGSSQGEAFMAALQTVPGQYFSEDFESKWDDFFVQFCQNQSAEELYGEIDELNKNLDVVELQLLREVAARSASFFQAAGQLQGLRGVLQDTLDVVGSLRRHVGGLDADLYRAAVGVAALQRRRGNLEQALDITKARALMRRALSDVLDCRQALEGMIESEDYADTSEAVRGMLVAEFLSALENRPLEDVVAAAAAEAAVAQARQQHDASSDAEPGPETRAAEASPFTQQLSILTALAAEAAGALHEKLLPLAVGLWRADKLGAAMAQYRDNVAAEVKGAIRDVVQQVVPMLLAAAGGDGGGGGGGGGSGAEVQLAEQLQALQHGAFMQLLRAVARVLIACCGHVLAVGKVLEEVLAGCQAHPSQVAALRKDVTAALQVAVDAGQGRWVKLLGARSSAHMRLRLYELKQLLDASEEVAAYAESCGARTLGSLRSSLQAQCKAFLDSQHGRCTMQLQHLLEGEQWTVVEVPASFQQIVDRLLSRCGEGAAMMLADGDAAVGPKSRDRDQAAPEAAGAAPAPAQAPAPQAALLVNGRRFHLVNSALMLLKMVDDYMSLYDIVPQFGAEIVHRELELLKQFNSQVRQAARPASP